MKWLSQVGKFFRVIDGYGRLSLTNIAVIVVLYKLGTSPSTNITEVGTLFIAMATYAFKKREEPASSRQEKFGEVAERASNDVARLTASHMDLEKMVSEVRDQVAKVGLAVGFNINRK